MSKYFDGEILSAYEDLNKEFEYKKENTKLQQQIIELQQQLKSQPKEIIEKIKNICCIEDKCEDGSFVLGINEKDLETILKDYES